ncbi:MAG TPA: TVP38/TMEM64 family protein [Caulobacter sp.]|nr:TVP38/TMEM64 family protein [Caulobacter sp.]
MKAFINFVLNMDARAWRAVAVSFLLFGGVGLVFLFGAPLMGLDGEAAVEGWLGSVHGVWGLPVAVGAFAVLAFLGVPQIVLIAAAVVAFGPWLGMAYSWIGTLVSAQVGFWLGRLFGAKLLRDLGGQSVNRFMKLIGQNGFLASLIVRLVPSAPFIVVNMAAGVTPMRMRHFTAGTGLGIIPKIMLTAFAGNSLVQSFKGEGNWTHYLTLAGVAAVWIGVGWYARRWLKAHEDEAEGAPELEDKAS